MQQTRDQKYATMIFRQIGEVEQTAPTKVGEDKVYRDAYGSMAHKLPVLIRTAGLAQALEFVEARGKKMRDGRKPHHHLLNHLSLAVLGEANEGKEIGLRNRSRNTEQLNEYMRLTHEALAALLWFKRFAQSVLDVEDANQGDKLMEEEEG